MNTLRLPAEWEPQDAIQITFPHRDSDWLDYWDDIVPCYRDIVRVISAYQPLLVVCRDELETRELLNGIELSNVCFAAISCNDTWARDHGAIIVEANGKPVVYDFVFNGWGLKFAADKDNLINRELVARGFFNSEKRVDPGLVLEGGGIECDGQGTLLTTTHCMLSPNRNPHLSRPEIENKLKELFGVQRVLWLEHGHLQGDDTDSHIDTIARFCDADTIAYVQCADTSDPHYEDLLAMEEELKAFRKTDGTPYKLIPLPMAAPIYASDDQRRLPATYANFLIMNEVVLVPTYGDDITDAVALRQLDLAFPSRKIQGIDCRALLLQHGSLHCITMQFPKGSINLEKFKP